jgi:hypothetical protein
MTTTFESIHESRIHGKLTMFDRLIFKGHLMALDWGGNFRTFLWRQGVPLKEFSNYVQKATAALKEHAQKVAADANRPYIYLQSTYSRAAGKTKEDLAREIAERDGIKEGLICVLSAVEPCTSFDLRKNRQGQLDVVRRRRKCLHFYYYLIDKEFGFMHIRLQSWFPMAIQIYVNGREWLCRQLDSLGIGYKRYDNALLEIDDIDTAQQLCERFCRRKWPRLLGRFARMVNPWIPVIKKAGFSDYYWVTYQCEIATDVMFKSRSELRRLMPDLLEHATLAMSAKDILRFAGGQRLRSEISTDHRERPEGRRVKHRIRQNSIKMYDKHSVLRVETTINNPREFKALRLRPAPDGKRSRRWLPMRKGVADFWRLSSIGRMANERYLEALAHAQPRGKAIKELDRLCQSRTKAGKRHARFNPVGPMDSALFSAVLSGQHSINGFRNRDLARCLYSSPPRSREEALQRSACVTRRIAKLRGHGLIAKVPRCRLYRITARGYRVMSAVLRFRNIEFPEVFTDNG